MMFSEEERKWIETQVKGQYQENRLDISINALDQFLTLNEESKTGEGRPYRKDLLAFKDYNDQEKKERLKDITDLENFSERVIEFAKPELLQAKPVKPKGDGRPFSDWTLAPLMVEIFRVFDDYELKKLSKSLNSFTDSVEGLSTMQNHYLRVYKYRNGDTHEGNIVYPELTPMDTTQLFISFMCMELDICFQLRKGIFSTYKMKARLEELNPKQIIRDIINEYEHDDANGYINVRWHKEFGNSSMDDEENGNEDIDELINNNLLYRTKFLGEAGTGKTTALKRIEYTYAKSWGNSSDKKIPVYVELSEIATCTDPSIIKCIANSLGTENEKMVEECLEEGELCILLDGYNELLDIDKKKATAKELDELAFKYQKCPIVLSSRTGNEMIPTLMNADRLYLTELSIEDKIQFFQKSTKDQAVMDLIQEKIEDEPEYFNDFTTPLKLIRLASIIENNGSFPDPENFVEQYITMLFDREREEKKEENMKYLPDYLRAIAIKMFNKGEGDSGYCLSEFSTKRVMGEVHRAMGYDGSDTLQCLDLALELGVLVKNGSDIAFLSDDYLLYFYFDGINYFDEEDDLIKRLQ